MNTINARFIAAASTQHTGGNCMADIIELKSGPVVVITDEVVCVYPNLKTWEDGPAEDHRALEFVNGEQSFARGEDSEVALTFVKRITTYEPDGPVSVDLLELFDGRVFGIDTDSLVLYPTMKDFESESGEGCADGVLSLVVEGGAE